jgi:hypothetical protein
MTRSGAKMIGRLAGLGTTVLAVLVLGTGLAKADVYNNKDVNYGGGQVGVGHLDITCYPALHRAWFNLELSGSFGPSVPQTVGAKIDTYRWNGQTWAYYGTTGWIKNYNNQITYDQWGGVMSGYWIHHVWYRWAEPDNTVTQGDEWISNYTLATWRPAIAAYTYSSAQYCTT